MSVPADPGPPAETSEDRALRLARYAKRTADWRPFADAINDLAARTSLRDLNGAAAAQAMPVCATEGDFPWYRLTFGGSSNPQVALTARQQRRHNRMARRIFRPTLGELLSGRDTLSLDQKMAVARGPEAHGAEVTELRVVPQDDGSVLTMVMHGSYSSKGPTYPPEFTESRPTVRGTCRTPAELTEWLSAQLRQAQRSQREGQSL